MADQPYIDQDARDALLASAVSPLSSAGIDPDAPAYDKTGRPQLQVRPGVNPNRPDNPTTASPEIAKIAPRPWERAAAYINPKLRALPGQEEFPSQVTGVPPRAAAPATVTPSGDPSRFEQAQSESMKAQQQAGKEYAAGPNPQAELAEEAKLAAQQKADQERLGQLQSLGGLRGKALPDQYRPTVGQRIMRGIQGYGQGGVFGAITAPYGAPNRQYDSDVTGAQSQVTADTSGLAEKRSRFKEAQEIINARTKAAQEQAKGLGEIAERETNQYKAENPPEKAAKSPTTAEGLAIDAAQKKFPDDPDKQLEYVRQNQFVDANTNARIEEARARRAEAQDRAAERKDTAAGNKLNQDFMKYQAQLLTYGGKKTGVDQRAQGEWDKLQGQYEKERKDLNEGSKELQALDDKYAGKKTTLQKNIDGWYNDLGKEPAMPPSLSGGGAAPAQAAPAAAPATQPKAQTFKYKGAQYTVGQTVNVDGKPMTITGFNPKTGKPTVK